MLRTPVQFLIWNESLLSIYPKRGGGVACVFSGSTLKEKYIQTIIGYWRK